MEGGKVSLGLQGRTRSEKVCGGAFGGLGKYNEHKYRCANIQVCLYLCSNEPTLETLKLFRIAVS